MTFLYTEFLALIKIQDGMELVFLLGQQHFFSFYSKLPSSSNEV
jgi:hypothetical protein